jgi:hypothetical protein
VLQVVVKLCPATSDPRDTLTVGFGVAAAVVIKVSDAVVVPPGPVAVQLQVDG